MPLNIPKPTRFIQAGYKPVEGGFEKKEDEKQETSRERAVRHRQERRSELTYDASDEARWARNRERVISERKKIEVPSFNLDDALKNPELNGVKSLNIAPVSMAVETVVDFIDGAKEFITKPSLGGLAAVAVTAIPGKMADNVIKRTVINKTGRAGKQIRLKELADDPKLGSSDRGWIQQEKNAISRGKRKTIRNPPGKDLAHERGREAAKGYGYEHSNLQEKKLHRLQHKYDNFGKRNKERPPQ